jgi:hypothetical protein
MGKQGRVHRFSYRDTDNGTSVAVQIALRPRAKHSLQQPSIQSRAFHQTQPANALFENKTDTILFDPYDSAIEHDAGMLCFQLKAVRDRPCVRDFDGCSIWRDIYEAAINVFFTNANLRRLIDPVR